MCLAPFDYEGKYREKGVLLNTFLTLTVLNNTTRLIINLDEGAERFNDIKKYMVDES